VSCRFGASKMQNTRIIFVALRRILTLKRFLLLVLFGILFGIVMARLFPAGPPWYGGVLCALTGFISLGLTLWLAPLKSDETNR
jgi:hypothetical protein